MYDKVHKKNYTNYNKKLTFLKKNDERGRNPYGYIAI